METGCNFNTSFRPINAIPKMQCNLSQICRNLSGILHVMNDCVNGFKQTEPYFIPDFMAKDGYLSLNTIPTSQKLSLSESVSSRFSQMFLGFSRQPSGCVWLD